jgi:hypothetical protein
MPLALENSPVFELVRKSDIWDIDWDCNKITCKDFLFIENDRQMVSDPMGQNCSRPWPRTRLIKPSFLKKDSMWAALVPYTRF